MRPYNYTPGRGVPKLKCEREGCPAVERMRVRAHDGKMVCHACFVNEAGEGKLPREVPPA